MDSVKRASYDSVDYMLKHMRQREERIAKVRKDLNLRPQDVLTLVDIPQGSKIKGGTLSYKKLTAKANRLQGEVASLKARIAQADAAGLPKDERARKLNSLRCQLAYTKVKLSAEVDASPRVYVAAREAEA